MSQSSARSANNQQQNADEVTINGTVYTRRANVTYRISKHGNLPAAGSLVDGGANGGLFGDDSRFSNMLNMLLWMLQASTILRYWV